ncbi:HNH endonuclease [Brevibacillus gelatini]
MSSIDHFYHDRDAFLECFWDDTKAEIVARLIKPDKWTIMHIWIDYCLSAEMDWLDRKVHDEFIKLQRQVLEDANMPIPKRGPVAKMQWEQALKKLTHTAFHLVYVNKKFLRDFNQYIAEQIEEDISFIQNTHPMNDENGKIKRITYWPTWLQSALVARDKGVCTICRRDISGLINVENGYVIDHVVPIANFGNNDPTNLQLLCSDCNLRKLNRSSETSGLDIPYWNLD